MKHKPLITIILLTLFLATQLVGLAVVNSYSPKYQINETTNETINTNPLPFNMEPPKQTQTQSLQSLLIAFAIAIALFFILIKFQFKHVIRIWFFVVVTIALSFTLYTITQRFDYEILIWQAIPLVATTLALILSALKMFRPSPIIHNFTEILIYPGIAAIFVGLLTPTRGNFPYAIIALLIAISIYDMWAVWHSGIMQKMAKFQMEEVRVFGGFLIPSASKKVKAQIKKWKESKNKNKNKKFKISLAILGGGDVIFPIIAAGVFMRLYGLLPALFVTGGAFAGLTFLLIISKKKFYPAMPFITAGIFLGIILSYLLA